MADPGDGSSSNPRTLAATDDAPLVEAPVSTSQKDYARQQEDLFYGYVADQVRSGHNLGFDKSTGKVFEYVESVSSGSAYDDFFNEGEGSSEGSGTSKKNYNTAAALAAQPYFDSWQSALRDLDRETDDAKAAKASGPAARSYLDTETDKTKEITRQYHDFEDRASLLYDLMGDEQDYAMAADDQNIANWKAQRDLGMATSPGGYYTTPYQSMTMSEILRPSLPDYVRPDYRLNESVGLPGPQGFDDPDYSPYGLPMFANGTAPLPPNFWPWLPRR